MQEKLFLVTIYFIGGWIACSFCQKTVERMSNFWTVQFLKTKWESNLCFPHFPSKYKMKPYVHFGQNSIDNVHH